MKYQQAFDRSQKWHKQLENKAKKAAQQIAFVAENRIILEVSANEYPGFGDWKWVWLKTDLARDREGEVMGHCVGAGAYDHLKTDEYLVSLRDPTGKSHVTMYGNTKTILQNASRKNQLPDDKYFKLIDDTHEILKLRLLIYGDISTPVPDGTHTKDGNTFYIKNQNPHRLDGPAIEWAEGGQEWWQNGKLHRDDGPAVIEPNGDEMWLCHGEYHRLDGPAIITQEDKLEAWYRHGQLHREDGPAYVTHIESNDYRIERWYQNDVFHREDGPAVIEATIHVDGDTITRTNETLEWWVHGKQHREDGPAVQYRDDDFSSEEYWINGEKVTHENFMIFQMKTVPVI